MRSNAVPQPDTERDHDTARGSLADQKAQAKRRGESQPQQQRTVFGRRQADRRRGRQHVATTGDAACKRELLVVEAKRVDEEVDCGRSVLVTKGGNHW